MEVETDHQRCQKQLLLKIGKGPSDVAAGPAAAAQPTSQNLAPAVVLDSARGLVAVVKSDWEMAAATARGVVAEEEVTVPPRKD